MPWIALSRASNLREGYACRHSVPTKRTSRPFPSKVNPNSMYYRCVLCTPVRSHLYVSYALIHIARFFTRDACLCITYILYMRVPPSPYTFSKAARVHARTSRREIRIIGSTDGSRGTGAGKSKRLSLLVANPRRPATPGTFLFCRNVNPTRQKQRGVHRRRPRDPCFRQPRTRSLLAPLLFVSSCSFHLRPSDCPVYSASRTIQYKKRPTTKKKRTGRRVLAARRRGVLRSLVLSAALHHFLRLHSRKRATDANQSNLLGRRDDLIDFIERMNGYL